jgi:hypothetical protein
MYRYPNSPCLHYMYGIPAYDCCLSFGSLHWPNLHLSSLHFRLL